MTRPSPTPDYKRRYLRQTIMHGMGDEGQQALLDAKILIIGAGGLGCPAATYLAAAGIGTLALLDFDRVDLSNLPRQILFETADIGRLKVDAARDRLLELNPDITVIPIAETVNADNAEALLAPYDIILDGSDNFETRFIISLTCGRLKKPLLSGAVEAWGGQVSCYTPYLGTSHPCYRCATPDAPDSVGSCQQAGVLGPAAGIIGCIMAQEAVKFLLGMESLSGRVIHYDARSLRFHDLKLEKDPACPQCGDKKPE